MGCVLVVLCFFVVLCDFVLDCGILVLVPPTLYRLGKGKKKYLTKGIAKGHHFPNGV